MMQQDPSIASVIKGTFHSVHGHHRFPLKGVRGHRYGVCTASKRDNSSILAGNSSIMSAVVSELAAVGRDEQVVRANRWPSSCLLCAGSEQC